MSKLTILNIKISLLSFIFNPGAIMLGFSAYSLTFPESPIPGFLVTQNLVFIFMLIGVILMAANAWYVARLTRQRNSLKKKNE